MSDTPLVSVVLPFRDAAATLEDAIESIAEQTLTAFECVLIDDASTDGSAARAAAFAAGDRRFRLVRGGNGLVHALNTGIAAARAPLLARMDADDISDPRRLELQVAALHADPQLSVVSSLVECFPTSAVAAGMRRYERWLNGVRTPAAIRDAMFVESPIPHPTALMRRAALTDIGGYRHTGGPEDYDLWLRLLLAGHRFAKVPAVLLRWRESPRRLSRIDARYTLRRFFATKLAHFPAAVPTTRELTICGAGPTGRRWARALAERGYRIGRFVDVAARRVGTTIRGIPVCPPEPPQRDRTFALAASGTPGARVAIERWLRDCGLEPWRDYLAVA